MSRSQRSFAALVVRVALLCAASTPVAVSATAQVPRFADYPAASIFRGKPRPPVLASKMARLFRTQLRQQATSGPNFAGQYTLARWGCGAGCVSIAIINAATGAVHFPQLSIEDGWKDGQIICGHAAAFELTSELLIVEGRVNGTIGRHYFRWHNRTLSVVHTEPSCSL
jgi:hypothetical protein